MPPLFEVPEHYRVKSSIELDRIVALPRRVEDAPDMSGYLRKKGGTMSLRPIQSQALYEIGTQRGFFGPLRVGAGKTLISLLAPVVAFARRPLLLVPAKLINKTRREREALSKHWIMPGYVRIMSYEMLGRAQAATALTDTRPDIIIADECHKLKNKDAAVTRRVKRYMADKPETVFVAMSGTITKRSLFDFAHILTWCFGHNRPLPNSYQELELWADALDERKGQTRRAGPGALRVLCDDRENEMWRFDSRRAARQAYRRRLVDTPGVIATKETSIDASLEIQGVEVEPPKVVDEAFKTLRELWETPDGWPISDGLAMFRHSRELALGFYYTWYEHEGFKNWLADVRKKEGNRLSTTEHAILSACERTTGRDTDLVKVVEILRKRRRESGHGILKPDTALLSKSTKLWSPSSTDVATFVGSDAPSQDPGKVVARSRLITIIEQAKLEGCSVSSATGRSECWAILLKAFPRLLSIFFGAIQATRPPEDWLDARKAWCKYVRKVLSHSRTLDSELQVRNACTDPEGLELLKAWTDIRDSFVPNTVPVWLSKFAVEHADAWARKNNGIIWTEHRCFGEALSTEYYGRRGENSRGKVIEDHPPGKPLAASIQSNAEGRNLQAWRSNLVTSGPPNGQQWEQLIGRTHRDGQKADSVTFDLMITCAEHVGAFEQAVSDSVYVFDTTGSPQKLLQAACDVPSADDIAGRTGPRWSQ